uniref:Uncharacterized protein n=1 Tax=Branchiostoma floridae TaxID=7739 RepID=C3YBA9_BRAFL|eukprot:XP_002606256.1 hypothetical protein BRAFLDRAFT_123704 [Branchiostoma floridae]
MASEFHAALDWTILSVPNTICVYWRALSLLYCAVAALTSGDSTSTYGVLLTGLSLMEIPIVYFRYGHFVVVTTKILNQAMLCVMLILVHNIREKREVPMSVRHRVCYSLLVENCAAYNLTWNYIQTVVLASAMLAQDFGVGPQAVSSVNLVLFSICVLFTMSIELVFPRYVYETFVYKYALSPSDIGHWVRQKRTWYGGN